MKPILAAVPKTLFTLAAIGSVIAGLFIFFSFGSTSITVSAESGSQAVQSTTSHLNWYESQGWWGIAILFIFTALFYGALHFYLRGKITWTVIFGLAVVILSIISGFSIGTIYWPGSLAVLVGLLALPFRGKTGS